MTIRFDCPSCKKPLKAPADKAGVRVPCPGCKQPVTIPSTALRSATVPGPPPVPPTRTGKIPPLPPMLEALPAEEDGQGQPPEDVPVELDDGKRRAGWVGYFCPGCKGRIRAPVADARAKGVCPACRYATTVPTRMGLRPAGAGKTPGMASNECPACKARLEAREEELGGIGVCPGCSTDVIFPALSGILERTTGPRQADRINFTHVPCGTDLDCGRGHAGTYARCPACGQQVRVPRWASITRDDRTRRDDRVCWRCDGCSTDVRSSTRHEGGFGVCPGCNGVLEVPRKGRAEGIAAAVDEIVRGLLLGQPGRRVAQAVTHLVRTCHPALGEGGVASFAEMRVVCDAVRAKSEEDCGERLYVWPAMLFAGTPINLVQFLRVGTWKGWHPKARVEGHVDTGDPRFDEAVFQERSLQAYPDHPDEHVHGLIGHRRHLVRYVSQYPGCLMLFLPGLYSCPSCKRWFAYVYEGSLGIHSSTQAEDRFVADSYQTDEKGYVVGQTHKRVRIEVATIRLLNFHRCRFCDHLWGSMGQVTGDVS